MLLSGREVHQMADIEKSIAECCKQLRLSTNFAEQTSTQKGDTHQEYLLNLLTNEINYRTEKKQVSQYSRISTQI